MNYKQIITALITTGFTATSLANIPVTQPSQGGQSDLIRAFVGFGIDAGEPLTIALAIIGLIGFSAAMLYAFFYARREGDFSVFLKTAAYGIITVVVMLFMADMAIEMLQGM